MNLKEDGGTEAANDDAKQAAVSAKAASELKSAKMKQAVTEQENEAMEEALNRSRHFVPLRVYKEIK